jgi:hypothetical protein
MAARISNIQVFILRLPLRVDVRDCWGAEPVVAVVVMRTVGKATADVVMVMVMVQ